MADKLQAASTVDLSAQPEHVQQVFARWCHHNVKETDEDYAQYRTLILAELGIDMDKPGYEQKFALGRITYHGAPLDKVVSLFFSRTVFERKPRSVKHV